MGNNFVKVHNRAFFEFLFLRLNSDNISRLSPISKIVLYILATTVFYFPILYFAIIKCLTNTELFLYFIIIVLIHILAKFMLVNSKKIQTRFSAIKTKEHFLIRTWLIIEYVAFMWLVYLFYPLACILAPISLLFMSFENFLGYSIIYELFLQNSEQFLHIGSIASYILFIITDGYKKLKSGFLPDYLGLYAALTFISSSMKGNTQKIFNYLNLDTSNITEIISHIFTLSNNSMNIIASIMTFFFAIYSLYTNKGIGDIQNDKE